MAVLSDQLRIEFGYGSTPGTALASVSWTDVTGSVMLAEGVSFSRGRSGKDSVARPGTLSFTLDNSQQKGTEGRFTLGGSNQVAGLALRIPVRVRVANVSGSTYTLWVGYVESMSLGWDQGWRPVVRVQATDRLARLQRRSLSSLVLGTQLNVESAVVAYPLDEPAGSLTFGNRSKVQGAPIFSTVTSSVTTIDVGQVLGPGDDRPSVTFTNSGGGFLEANGIDGIVGATGQQYVELFFKPTAGNLRLFSIQPYYGSYVSVGITSGVVLLDYSLPTVGTGYLSSTITADDGVWNHIGVGMIYGSGSLTLTVQLNGQTAVSTIVSTTGMPQCAKTWIGQCNGYGGLISHSDGSVANFAVYDSVSPLYSTSTAITRDGAANVPASYRFSNVCQVAGISDYATSGTTAAIMGAQKFDGRQLLDAVNDIATTEQGVAYVDKSGVLTLAARGQRYNPTASFTLPAAVVDAGTDFATDMAFLVNDVTVGRPDGITYRATNDTSVTAYETHNDSVTIYPNSDSQVVDTANWLANIEATPKPRVTDIAVDLVTAAASVTTSAVVQAEVGQMFQVTGLPSASTPASTLSLFVEGIADRVTEKSWVRTFNTSPVHSAYTVWVLGDSTLGVLNSTTKLAF